jgi:hypothetical protein
MTQHFIPTTVFLAVCSVQAVLAADTGKPYTRDEGDLWVAGNDTIEIAVNRKTGTIRRLLDRVSKEDYCNQVVAGAVPEKEFTVGERIAGISLLDELTGREFSDLTQSAAIARLRTDVSGGRVALSLEKSFPGAEFVVAETFTVSADHLRWDVRVRKTAGRDRTLRVVQFTPLPLGHYRGWAPISDEIPSKPYVPFAIEYGQSVSGSVGESRWRTNIPMMVYYSLRNKRALSLTCPFEVPAVRIRFLNNTGAGADFHWNSRHYPPRERPYLQVSNEYLGLRGGRDLQTGLLIATHPADWRPALGWVYSKYQKYFDPDPKFDRWDGAWAAGATLLKDSSTDEERRKILDGRRQRGVRWEEQHGHFPWYGLMIPAPDVTKWVCESHPMPGTTITREKVRDHQRMNNEFGIGTFIYYNTTEAEHWYAQDKFPESVAKDEDGQPIGAYKVNEYPGKRACWMMNSDPKMAFGQHMIQQARDMVASYPEMAGFFWDVYGRSYMFDFAHDDGITMVNNKPAYYPGFMFERMMREVVGPLLHSRGMCITANKPVTISACEGLDGIMVIENTPEEETPAWIAAQSYLGLTRHVMILDGGAAKHAELFFQDCLRYGMFYSDLGGAEGGRSRLTPEQMARNAEIEKAYAPFIQRLRGKKWIFYPEALRLPANTDGNIFRLKDGSVMITMTSPWRILRKAEGFDAGLQVVCRLPDAAELGQVYASSLDLGETAKLEPQRKGDTLTLTVPKHGRSTVILLSRQKEAGVRTGESPSAPTNAKEQRYRIVRPGS